MDVANAGSSSHPRAGQQGEDVELTENEKLQRKGPENWNSDPQGRCLSLRERTHGPGPHPVRRCWYLREGCKKVGSASVGRTANWLQLLLQEGSASARAKSCCWGGGGGHSKRKHKAKGNRQEGACLPLLPPAFCLHLASPIWRSHQGASSQTEMWFAEVQPQHGRAKYGKMGLEATDNNQQLKNWYTHCGGGRSCISK